MLLCEHRKVLLFSGLILGFRLGTSFRIFCILCYFVFTLIWKLKILRIRQILEENNGYVKSNKKLATVQNRKELFSSRACAFIWNMYIIGGINKADFLQWSTHSALCSPQLHGIVISPLLIYTPYVYAMRRKLDDFGFHQYV